MFLRPLICERFGFGAQSPESRDRRRQGSQFGGMRSVAESFSKDTDASFVFLGRAPTITEFQHFVYHTTIDLKLMRDR